MNIKIISNVLHDDLYDISQSFYESLPYEKIVVSGKNGLYNFKFLHHVITDTQLFDVEWCIFIDEDCFITNKNAFQDLINYVIENNIDAIGMPDGGVSKTRIHNPLVINPFFCILNIKNIRKIYDLEEVNNSFFTDDLKQYAPFHLLKYQYYYSKNREPYYKLFFWMIKRGFKIEYLDAYNFDDKITTILKNHKNIDFAYHTWNGRDWGIGNERIKNVINHCKNINK